MKGQWSSFWFVWQMVWTVTQRGEVGAIVRRGRWNGGQSCRNKSRRVRTGWYHEAKEGADDGYNRDDHFKVNADAEIQREVAASVVHFHQQPCSQLMSNTLCN
jgi:hypothetical protein